MSNYIRPSPDLPDEVTRELGFWVSLHASRDFLGSEAKTHMVRALRAVRHSEDLTAGTLYDWLLSQEDCTPEGASRIVEWYRKVLEDRRFREGSTYI